MQSIDSRPVAFALFRQPATIRVRICNLMDFRFDVDTSEINILVACLSPKLTQEFQARKPKHFPIHLDQM